MTKCLDCGVSHGIFTTRAWSCPLCKRYPLCWGCLNYATIPKNVSDENLCDTRATHQCFSCFEVSCELDMSKTFDVIGPDENEAIITVVFAHGSGACRASFCTHAKKLATTGVRSVLLDLPGHGARVKEKLTMESAFAVITNVTKLTCAQSIAAGKRPVFVGANLGGYIGMEFLGKYPDIFRAAAIVVAGQNVGKGAKWKAILPLRILSFVMSFCSSERVLNLLLKDIKYSVKLNRASVDFGMARECSIGCSVYFQQTAAQIECFRSTDSLKAMSWFHGDVWYAIAGGDKFEQDMAEEILNVSKRSCTTKNSLAYQTSYPGANRFFTHDLQYYESFVRDLMQFLRDVVG